MGYQCCARCKALLCVPPDSEIDDKPTTLWPLAALVDDQTWQLADRGALPVCWESTDPRYQERKKPPGRRRKP